MKTAMQELFDEMISINWHLYSYEDKIKIINVHLEKEKEQIIDFHVMLMKHGLEQEGNGIEWDYNELKKEAEEYYNKTYNQNK